MDEAFKVHSVRGASTSAAMARGVSLADILHNAAESTFRRSTITGLDQWTGLVDWTGGLIKTVRKLVPMHEF